MIDKFKCNDKEEFQIYDKGHMPKRFHYAKTNRIGDFVLNGHPGTIFFPLFFFLIFQRLKNYFFRSEKDDYKVTADHGYDYLTDSMHAIFFARGPNIKSGLRLAPFQNVELFNLFAGLSLSLSLSLHI